MRGNVAEPVHARRLAGRVGVEADGDGAMNDGLFLLVQEFDQAAFGLDKTVYAAVGVFEKTYNGVLFVFAAASTGNRLTLRSQS